MDGPLTKDAVGKIKDICPNCSIPVPAVDCGDVEAGVVLEGEGHVVQDPPRRHRIRVPGRVVHQEGVPGCVYRLGLGQIHKIDN